jgi:hypothetical protein
MSVTAGEVILSARDQHPALTTGRIPPPVLYRELTRYQQRLYARVAGAVPDTLAQTVESIALPLGTFPSKVLTVELLQPIDVEAVDASDWSTPVEILAYSDRMARADFPAVAFRESTIYLLGFPDWWVRWVTLKVRYVPQAAAIVADATALSLPTDARDPCVAAMAAFMARRLAADGSPMTAPVVALLGQAAAEAEALFLARIGAFRRPQTFRIRDVG